MLATASLTPSSPLRPGMFIFCFMHLALATTAVTTRAVAASSKEVMLPLSSDSDFSFMLHQTISLSNGGGANTGEVLRLASQIVPSDFESFYDEFYSMASQLHDQAAHFEAQNHLVAARDTYFRSSTYYRNAVFYLTGNTSDPRVFDVFDQGLKDFDKAIGIDTSLDAAVVEADSLQAEPLSLNHSSGNSAEDGVGENRGIVHVGTRYNVSAPLSIRPNFTAPIIFYSPGGSSKSSNLSRRGSSPAPRRRRPTVLWGNGYDAPQEDGYHSYGKYVLELGWNFVTYEGPGQNTVRRTQNIGFVPDWWNVVSPVVDFLEARDDVDGSRIALVGHSFGGILAPLAASQEHRVAAAISIDGIYSVTDATLDQLPHYMPAFLVDLYNDGNKSEFDRYMNDARHNSSTPTIVRWIVDQGLWCMKTSSPYDWLQQISKINLSPEVVANVSCPVFIGNGDDDTMAPGQAASVVQWLQEANKTVELHKFNSTTGAGMHCQIGAEGQKMAAVLNWLNDVAFNSTTRDIRT